MSVCGGTGAHVSFWQRIWTNGLGSEVGFIFYLGLEGDVVWQLDLIFYFDIISKDYLGERKLIHKVENN